MTRSAVPMRVFCLLAVVSIVYLSLYPWHFENRAWPGWGLTYVPVQTRGDLADVVANLLFYLPLGFTGLWVIAPGRFRWRAVAGVGLFGFVLSYGIELAQYFTPGRYPNWRDVLCNAAGTLAGAGVAAQLQHAPRWGTVWLRRTPPIAWWLLGCWVMAQAYPFIPVLRVVRFYAVYEQLWNPAGSLLEAGDTLLLTWTLATALGEQGSGLRWVAFSVMLGQGFLAGHTFSLLRTTMAAMAFLLWGVRRRAGCYITPPVLAGGWLLWLLFRQGYPFQHLGEPQEFQWVPFSSLTSMSTSYICIIFGKVGIYSSALWALGRLFASQAAPLLLVLPLLAATEWWQRYLPGRVPETTDLVLVLAAALAISATRPAGVISSGHRTE